MGRGLNYRVGRRPVLLGLKANPQLRGGEAASLEGFPRLKTIEKLATGQDQGEFVEGDSRGNETGKIKPQHYHQGQYGTTQRGNQDVGNYNDGP